MTDIPEIVYAQARNECEGITNGTSVVLIVARAIRTERERCARIVEQGLGKTNTTIARAIRNGDTP